MKHPYTLGIIFGGDGNMKSATVGSQGNVGVFGVLPIDQLPPYVHERIALLRLTTTKEEGVLGRKLNDLVFTIYLTYDEYKELNSLSGSR